jgi:two-component system, cell cycle sensor histidine kinase and response regulator CckA
MPHGGQLTLATEIRVPQTSRGKLAAGRMTNDVWHPSGVAGNRWIPSLSLPAAWFPREISIATVVLRITATASGVTEPLGKRISRPILSTAHYACNSAMRLTTVMALLRELGGTYEIENQQGESFVALSLPTRYSPMPSAAPTVSTHESEKLADNILVAEDIDHIRTIIYSVLTMHGYTVLLSANGVDARTKAQSSDLPISLLITDLKMPEMAGKQLAAEMLATQPDLRVLFLSGYTSAIVQDPDFIGKTLGFLEKPFTLECLVHKVRELLETPRS